MVDDSVDNMYFGCSEAMMMTSVKQDKFQEMTKGPLALAWHDSEECARKMENHIEDKALTEEHLQAIRIYTGDNIYNKFDTAAWTNSSFYGSSFQFHSLHFLLTSALKIRSNNYNCHTTKKPCSFLKRPFFPLELHNKKKGF